MNGNGKAPIPFPNPGVPLVGQPFTLKAIFVPCNVQLSCNCGGAETDVKIENSVAAACPSCRRIYNAAFNPLQNKVEFQLAVPEPPKEPS